MNIEDEIAELEERIGSFEQIQTKVTMAGDRLLQIQPGAFRDEQLRLHLRTAANIDDALHGANRDLQKLRTLRAGWNSAETPHVSVGLTASRRVEA